MGKLESYPNFEHISPMHYNENNILKLTIEGAFVRESTNCETFVKMTKHSKLILRTLFRWIFNRRFAGIISKRFLLTELGLESYRVQSVSSIVRFTKDYTECLKNDFFRILNKLNISKQLSILDEIRVILSVSSTSNDMRNLVYLSQNEIHLDKMTMNFHEIAKPQYFIEFIENVTFTKLFTLSRNKEINEIEERKQKIFGHGVEVLRFRLDLRGGAGSAIRGVGFLQSSNDFDIFILFNKTLKKYSLFKCLFNRMRQNNGLKLLQDVFFFKIGSNRGQIRV